MSKTILNLIEINLLLNSEEVKNTELYGNLYSVLSNLQKRKAVSIDDLSDLDQTAKTALLHSKKNMIDIAVKEWHATTDIRERPQRDLTCELCNTKIKYLCYIFNHKNNIELRVGSECIKKFPNMDGYIEHNKRLKEMHKGQKIIARRNKFYMYHPTCEDDIAYAEKYFNTLPVLLPYELYTKLQDVVSRMRLIYSKYVNEEKKPFNSNLNSFQLFDLAVKQFNELKPQSDIFVSQNKDNPLICKRKEIDWMISEGKTRLLQQISENDGVYTLSTIQRILSKDFISNYTDDIFNRNQSQTLRFTKIDNTIVYIKFEKIGYQPSITFKMTIEDFMKEIGAKCIMQPTYTYNLQNFIVYIDIANTKSNLESILAYISSFIYDFNCVFLFDDENNNLILCRRGDKAIRIFNNYNFLVSYSKYITKSDAEIKQFLFNLIKGRTGTKWIDVKMQSLQGIDNRINKLYQEQYLDIKEQFVQYRKSKYVEITTYNITEDDNGYPIIDFDHPTYQKVSRRQIRVSDNTMKNIEYALFVPNNILKPRYSQGTMLLVQNITSVRNDNTIFYVDIENDLSFKRCYTIDEYESIFKHIPISKKNLKSYGRIVYSFVPNFKD